jgi:localization factor PodJL
MKPGGPWNLRGLRPETVEAAREAARRSGMSVGEWLNNVVRQRDDYRRATMQFADYAGEDPYGWRDEPPADDHHGRYSRPPRRDYAYADETAPLQEAALARDEFGEIHARLDTLTRELERLARSSAPLRGAPVQPPHQARRRSPNLASDAGFAARATDAAKDASREPDLPSPATAPQAAGEPTDFEQPVEFPDLEAQLRRITAQIESLRPSAELDKVIAGFRSDLAEIRLQLTEALPRQAVESLCAEVEALARRIDRSREWAADLDAIAGIERGLAEIRDALRGMTTAENLVGFDEALKALAQKLDLIIAKEDPAALEQLETAIGALRGVVSHVASNDALNKVAEDVRGLAAKVDALAKGAATGHAVSALESRIDTLADALNTSTEAGQSVPRELEKLLSSLIEKLEWVRQTATDPSIFKRLEERIVQLIGRLEASDARLGNLAAIERTLADLLAHIDQLRGGDGTGIGTTPRPPAVAAIAQDVAEIKRSERRTQDSLEAVHSTVEQVVGRLAMIESDIHDTAMRAPRSQIPARPAGPSTPPQTADTRVTASPAASSAATPVTADNGDGKPAATGEPSDKQDFIAAARRATQAAAFTPGDYETRSGSRRRRRSRRSAQNGMSEAQENRPSRLRKLLVAAGIVLVTVGCLQIALHIFEDTRPGGEAPAPLQHPSQRPSPPVALPQNNSGAAPPRAQSPATAVPMPGSPRNALEPGPSQAAPTEPAPPVMPVPGASDAGASAKSSESQNSVPDPSAAPRHDAMPAPATPPTAAPPPPPLTPAPAAPEQHSSPNNTDPTGSLPRSAAVSTAPLPPLAAAPTNPPIANAPGTEAAANILPSTIGGPALRAAAMAGDTAAEFEIAIRFAEGRGVPANERQAAHWLELAAKQGSAPAQFRLGGYYEKGIGVKKDLTAARDLYLAAAAKGNGKAMHNLAVLYAEGINGRSDYRTAVLWFRKAADRGITDSQYNLAILCARGTGEPQNYAEAYKWFALAAKQGDLEAARKRDEIASELDEKTLAAADSVVRNWKPEPQPDDAMRVKTPPGGWDAATQPARAKARTTSARLTAPDSKPDSKAN